MTSGGGGRHKDGHHFSQFLVLDVSFLHLGKTSEYDSASTIRCLSGSTRSTLKTRYGEYQSLSSVNILYCISLDSFHFDGLNSLLSASL
jgi:hypothetical protein